MTVIEYTCKFCKHHRAVEADLSECPPPDLKAFKALLACNRCSDFTRTRKDVEEAIFDCCVALIRARQSRRGDNLKEFETRLTEKFTNLTRWFASVVCKHYNMPFNWDSEFVSQIMLTPNRAEKLLAFYHRNVTRYAATQQEMTTV